MPVVDIIGIQRRVHETGRIRIGQQVPTEKGSRPAKLETFRFTSQSKTAIEQAARLYGGTVAAWEAPAGSQWEVITDADVLKVVLPPSDLAFNQAYELWSAAGCQRRCDGENDTISEGPCLCNPDKRDCALHTRLSVMLADMNGLGLWRLESQGWNAAAELQGAVRVIEMAARRGELLPAFLRLEQRMTKRPGEGTKRFAVPVLDVAITPAQLISGRGLEPPRAITADPTQTSTLVVEGGTAGQTYAVPVPAPGETARPNITPLPADGSTPPTVAEQAAKKRTPKRRAPTPPKTGVEPRTQAQADQDAGQVVEFRTPGQPARTERVTDNQILNAENGIPGPTPTQRAQQAAEIIGDAIGQVVHGVTVESLNTPQCEGVTGTLRCHLSAGHAGQHNAATDSARYRWGDDGPVKSAQRGEATVVADDLTPINQGTPAPDNRAAPAIDRAAAHLGHVVDTTVVQGDLDPGQHLARRGPDPRGECVCGHPEAAGVRHRADGPCYLVAEPPPANGNGAAPGDPWAAPADGNWSAVTVPVTAERVTMDLPEPESNVAQNRKMHALFRELGMGKDAREDRLIITGHILGGPVDTSKGMTVSQASRVIDAIDRRMADGTAESWVRDVLNAATLAEEENADEDSRGLFADAEPDGLAD